MEFLQLQRKRHNITALCEVFVSISGNFHVYHLVKYAEGCEKS